MQKPMFEKIVGHERNKRIFTSLISNKDRLSHAYMFVGDVGIGKRTFADEIANEVSGLNRNIHLIVPDKNIINVDMIRNMQTEIAMPPFNGMSNMRIVIIDNAECMNEPSQNALLKILEEPPAYVIIIMIVSNPQKLLTTINSRCSIIKFYPLEDEIILETLAEKGFDKSLTEFMLVFAGGSIGSARELIDNPERLDECTSLYKFSTKLINLSKLDKSSHDIKEFLTSDKAKTTSYLKMILNYYMKLYYKSNDEKIIKVCDCVSDAVNNIESGGNLNLSILLMIMSVFRITAVKK